MGLQNIKQKILDGKRINEAESLMLFREGNLYDLGFLANFIRKQKHPDPVVTYVIDRNINYTDICISACKFCAFYKTPEDPHGSVLSFEELEKKIAETKELGGTQILLQGGLHPDKQLDFYEEMLRFIKGTGIHIHGFSPPEICPGRRSALSDKPTCARAASAIVRFFFLAAFTMAKGSMTFSITVK